MERIEISNMERTLVTEMGGYIPVEEYDRYEQLKYLEIEHNEIGVIIRGTRITRVIVIGE